MEYLDGDTWQEQRRAAMSHPRARGCLPLARAALAAPSFRIEEAPVYSA
jgi:hypothetical protein